MCVTEEFDRDKVCLKSLDDFVDLVNKISTPNFGRPIYEAPRKVEVAKMVLGRVVEEVSMLPYGRFWCLDGTDRGF